MHTEIFTDTVRKLYTPTWLCVLQFILPSRERINESYGKMSRTNSICHICVVHANK